MNKGTNVVDIKATLAGGMLVVVPRGCWHRFQSQEGVTVLTMTPRPTEHTVKEDPRD